MKTLINQVKHVAAKTKMRGHSRDFLDHSLQEPMCQKIIQAMQNVDLRELGITGSTSETDKYHF